MVIMIDGMCRWLINSVLINFNNKLILLVSVKVIGKLLLNFIINVIMIYCEIMVIVGNEILILLEINMINKL